MARDQGVQRVAGQQAVGVDLHRRVEVVEEVVIGDVDVRAKVVRERRWREERIGAVRKESTDCDGRVWVGVFRPAAVTERGVVDHRKCAALDVRHFPTCWCRGWAWSSHPSR